MSDRLAPDVEVRIDGARSESRLRRWRELIARRELDGLDAHRAAAVVGQATWRDPPPQWAVLVAEGIERAADPELDQDRCLPGGNDRVALEELSVVFVRAARVRLEARIELPASIVGAGVLTALEQQLLAQLGWLASTCAEVESRMWRRRRIDPLAEAISRATGTPGRGLYMDWINELRGGGLARLIERYPVLARQLGTLALGWVDATVEFFAHLKSEIGMLEETFGAGRALGSLVEVAGALSDPHRGRRRVIGCKFESGVRLVYKPKSLRTEMVHGSLLRWLNERGADPPLRVLGLLDRGDHGWVEMAEQAGVGDEDAARRFYRRTGMLLALMYALGGKDCHAENFVAAREDPVVVDAESILHPSLDALDAVPGAEPDALHAVVDSYSDSVLGVGILPDWMISPDGEALDVSALGAVEPQRVLELSPRWDHAGTDVARLVPDKAAVGDWANVLRICGRAQRPEHYVDEVSTGFTSAYRIMLRGRDELLGSHGPLSALENAPVRVLVRSTMIYTRAFEAAQLPGLLSAGVDHSIELEVLGRTLLDSRDPAAVWELNRREQQQLEATDVPYFAAPGGARALCADDGRPIIRFRMSAVETARQTLRAMSEGDLRVQLALLRAALGSRAEVDRQLVCEDRSREDRFARIVCGHRFRRQAAAAMVSVPRSRRRFCSGASLKPPPFTPEGARPGWA